MNLSDRFCTLIHECVSTPAYLISLNDEVRGFLKGMQGHRQGDPLSPFLFGLCIVYLSQLFKARTVTADFHFHPKVCYAFNKAPRVC